MIEIRKNENIENTDAEYQYNIYLNGVFCDGAGVYIRDVDMQYGVRVLEANDFSTITKLKELPLSEFNQIEELIFNGWNEFDIFTLNVEINRYNYKTNQLGETTFKVQPNFSFWKKSFNFVEYQELFHEILNDKFSELNFIYGNNKYNESTEIIYYIYHDFNRYSIGSELNSYENALLQTHNEIIEILQNPSLTQFLSTSFDFPENLKFPCEQYLLYFAQFLQDLGINATSNLKEEAGKVFFSVTPTDDVEALDKIREALAIYLKLPESPIIFDDSFKSMRMQQQIENLQHSQKMMIREIQVNEKLLLAQSDMIREKNITISQQQTVVENQNKIIEKISSRSIMMDSVENKEEFEKIYDGLEAGHSKWLYELTGIKANFIKMISTSVKNTFPKDEKKSILGLDED